MRKPTTTEQETHKKQLEVYTAKAMLLGLHYSEETHSMWGAETPDHVIQEFDADTLQPLTREELVARADRYYEEHGLSSSTPDSYPPR